tara:strand:- start:57 stop:995 length:939 start_codon:yes stop_codon:yes gene_type:complete
METNFFVIGENPRTAFFLRNIKIFLILLLLIITGLSVSVLYLYYKNILDQENFILKIKQEKTRSENLVKKIKQTGQKDALWEQQVLSQSSQQKKLNEQQASLLERQRRELAELNSILEQREQVVYQFQNEKKSTQEQINILQQKVISLEQELTDTKNSLNESISENKKVEEKLLSLSREKNKLENKQKKQRKIASTKVTAIKKRKSKNLPASIVSIEKLKITYKNGFLSVNYNLTNKTNRLQLGRTGMYLSSKKNLEKDIPFRLKTSIPYKIKRYRIISRKFSKVKPGSYLRILIWNNKKQLLIDNAYPIQP